MHTTYQARHYEPGYEWIADHNGDYSGNVILTKHWDSKDKTARIEVPFAFLVQLVGQAIIDRKVAELEGADPFAFLKLTELVEDLE